MLTHAHFLKQIQATPSDQLPRLIYADWLEEQGDLGGELIRIEQEIYHHRPWSDRYTELRKRRRELLPQVSDQFRADLDLEPKHIPLFSELPDHWEHRWRLYEAFFDNWCGGIAPGDCEGEDVIARTEARLNVKLPAALRHWLLRGGSRHGVWQGFNPYSLSLVPMDAPDTWRIEEGFLLLGVTWPWVTDFEWAIRPSEPDDDDPRIYIWHQARPPRLIQSGGFSEWALRQIIERLVYRQVPTRAFAAPPEPLYERCLEQLRRHCHPVAVSPVHPADVDHLHLEFRELLVDCETSSSHIRIRARTREICVHFLNLLGDCGSCFGLSSETPP